MSKKTLNTSNITNELRGASLFFANPPSSQVEEIAEKRQTHVTPRVTRKATQVIDRSRDRSSDPPREKSRELPTREEIQEFSFRLRDDLKVKVQAEVPHQWQDELEELARKLDVKKLELYRFIIGEFLGKIDRKHNS